MPARLVKKETVVALQSFWLLYIKQYSVFLFFSFFFFFK